MALKELLRTPTGIVALAFAVVVVGVAVAAYLLNVPLWLVLVATLITGFLGFWLVTRTDPDRPVEPPSPPPAGEPKPK